MPQTVEIPGQGIAEFPDEMSPDQIKGVIKDKFFPEQKPASQTAPEPQGVIAQSESIGGTGLSDYPATINPDLAEKALETPGIPAGVATDFLRSSPTLGLTEALFPKTEPYIRGATESLGGTLSGLTTLPNVDLLLATGGLGKLGQTAIGAGFTAAAATHLPEQWKAYNETTDPAVKAKMATDMATTLVMGGLVAAHAAGGLSDKLFPKETPKAEPPPIPEVPPVEAPPEPVAPAGDTPAATIPEAARTPEQVAATEHAIDATTVTPVGDAAPATEVPASKPKVFRGPADAFGSDMTPVAAAVMEDGLMSKSTAKKNGMYAKNPDLWDDAPLLDHPTHGKIYAKETVPILDAKGNETGKFKTVGKGGTLPDVAAQNLFDAGLINEPTPGAMWSALKRESQTARALAREDRGFSKAEAAAHSEWQDQLKHGEQDPGIALRGPDGEPALITKSATGEGVELSLLDKGGNPAVSLEHPTLDDALKSAHEQGFLLDDGSHTGKVIFDESASRAGNADSTTAGETAGAPPETVGELPQLRAGEKQGDLLSKQTEDLSLVGEKGTDFGARQADAEAAAKAKAEGEQGQPDIFDKHDWTGATEPPEQTATRLKLKAKAAEGGFINPDVLKDVVDFGARIARRGLDFVKWSAEMVRHLGEGIKGHLKTVWDSLTGKNLLPGRGESGAIGGIGIRKMSPLDAATGERSARLQQSFADAERAQKEIRKAAPTERRQAAISVWMEANGDGAKLDQWAQAAKGDAFKRAAEDAKKLSPAELSIAQKAQTAFKVLEQRGNQYDVLGNHRDNYVPHVWDVAKKFTGIGESKLQDKFKFNKARTFENFFEGDQAGFKPKTMAIGKLLPSYLHEMNKVIADRQFVQDVSDMKATDNRPLVVPRGNAKTVDTTDYVLRNPDGSPMPKFSKSVFETEAEAKAAIAAGGHLPGMEPIIEKRPSSAALVNPRGFAKAEDAQGNPIEQGDYKVPANQPALSNWRWMETDPQGGTTILKSDLAVHPELAKRLNAMMGKSAIREWYNEPSTGLSVIPKAIAKGLDTAQAVMKREMFGLLAPFHQVQEGTHAIGHTVNPFGGIPDMSRPTPAMTDAMKHGLTLLPDRASSAGYMEGLGGKGTFLTQAARWFGNKPNIGETLVGKAARGLADTIDGYQNYLFHQYIPGLKFKTYDHIFQRNMERYAGDLQSGKVTPADVKLLSAEQTNAAYGHLNLSLLDRNPTIQHIVQLSLLAPDFLEARARFTGQALKSLAGDKAGFEQFRAIAVLAAVQAGAAYVISKSMGDDWDPKHPFEVTHNGRRYMMRSLPEDISRLAFQGWDSTREFASARINPALQKGVQLETGLNYRGEKTGPLETLGELLANYIPITARSIPGLRSLTETSRNNPVSPLEQLAGSAGLKISRYSPITKVHQLANDWMDAQKIERTEGTYPVSKFQPLRYALEDGDMERSQKEWQKLLNSVAGDDAKLRRGFESSINHPFTVSKQKDQEFADSLTGKDRLIYDRALEVRQGILDKSNSL